MDLNKKYSISNNEKAQTYRITLPKLLVHSLGRTPNDKVIWKLHPNGKDLICEFVK